jgi:hypothetical protein
MSFRRIADGMSLAVPLSRHHWEGGKRDSQEAFQQRIFNKPKYFPKKFWAAPIFD